MLFQNPDARYIVANWKALLPPAGCDTWGQTMRCASSSVVCGVCPPASHIHALAAHTTLALGLQDTPSHGEGAHTGTVPATIGHDAGCVFTLTGHSEVRQRGATSSDVSAAGTLAIEADLSVLVCVGEDCTADDGQGYDARALTNQVLASLPANIAPGMVAIAYEPVWAIGTGVHASTEQIASAIACIRLALKQADPSCHHAPILYGGSVKPSNAKDVAHASGCCGVLVGGASLDSTSFSQIADAFSRT